MLPVILLIFSFASCASYHDGHKEGIFLSDDASMPVQVPISAMIEFQEFERHTNDRP